MKVLDALVKAGTPEARLKAARFEDFVVRVVLPFLGGHVYLGAIVYQYDIHPEMARACALVAACVGGLLLAMSATGVLAAVGTSSVLAAALFVLPPWAAAAAIGIAVVAYGFAATSDRIKGAGAALFFLHVPVLSAVAIGIPTVLRVSVTMSSLLLAAGLLMARRRAAFAGAALTGGLLVAIVETELEQAPRYVAGFVALLAMGAMIYEMRRERKTQSPLRRAVAQSLAVLLLFVFAGLVTGWDESGMSLWWLMLVVVVQGIQMVLEGGKDVIRPVWPAIALVTMLWMVEGLGDWRLRAAMTCAGIAALHAYALRRRSRFVAVVAAALTIVPAAVAFDQTERGVFEPGGFVVQALITLTLLAQGVDPELWRREYRWWRGFIPRMHWRTLTNMSSMAAKAIENAAVVGALVKGFRAVFDWVRYVNGGAAIRLHNVVYAVAHLYGAWMAGGQVTAMSSAGGASWPAAALAGQVAWIAWALALLLYGEVRGDVLSRYVGLVLVCVPAVTDVNWQAEPIDLFELWLLAATGAALTAYAAARLRQPVSRLE